MAMGNRLALPAFLLMAAAALLEGASPQGAPPGPAALQQEFSNLYDSLRNEGGVTEAARPVLERFRQRVAAVGAAHPDDPAAVAIELQVSLWLGDEQEIDRLYGRLTALTGDARIGLAWARHLQEAGQSVRVGEVYQELARRFPSDAGVVVAWAEFFRQANLFARALEVIQSGHLDPATHPDAAILLSDCLFAEHRFAEAVAALDSIPPEALSADEALRKRVEPLVAARREYQALWDQEQQIRSQEAHADDLPRAEIVTAQGRIVVELFENQAANTVANFIALADSGFYDGTTFHRVAPNTLIEGGDPNSRTGATAPAGSGGPGYRILDEHDLENARRHFAGSLGMANSGTPHTAGSRFYITFVPVPDLNAKHTVFGTVIEGLDVARSLQAGDAVESVTVLRRRNHEYKPATLPDALPAPAPEVVTTPVVPPELAPTRTPAPPPAPDPGPR